MQRILVAAALAAVVLPVGAFEAAAAPGVVTSLNKTYTLQCSLNASDGEALKVRMMVKNTTGRIINKDTPITIRYVYGFAPNTRPNGPRLETQKAWRNVDPGQSIGFDQPRGARYCFASVTLRRVNSFTR